MANNNGETFSTLSLQIEIFVEHGLRSFINGWCSKIWITNPMDKASIIIWLKFNIIKEKHLYNQCFVNNCIEINSKNCIWQEEKDRYKKKENKYFLYIANDLWSFKI